jgi:peroxiredoxin
MNAKTRIALVAAVLLIMASVTPLTADPEIGRAAPDFTGADSNGQILSLDDFRGKLVVLEWTNHDCPYVRKHYGTDNMQTLQKKWTERGVVWLSIISSAPGRQGYVTGMEADELTQSRGASPTAVILDPEGSIGRLYRARTTPHMFVIDTDGVLVYMGGIDDRPSADWASVDGSTNYVDEALRAAFGGRDPEVSVSRPYGCSVKY